MLTAAFVLGLDLLLFGGLVGHLQGDRDEKETLVDENENQTDDIVTLVDEEGKNHDFQVVDIIEVDYKGEDREYALLLPADDDGTDDDAEVLVLRFLEDRFEMIDDEDEFQNVVKVLEELDPDEE